MMAPKYERARMLEAAIHTAVYELDDPIDRIEVEGGRVVAWAGSRRLSMRYAYVGGADGEGRPMPGSGHWEAVPDEGELRKAKRWFGWLRFK
jgi:hypothetical protein